MQIVVCYYELWKQKGAVEALVHAFLNYCSLKERLENKIQM